MHKVPLRLRVFHARGLVACFLVAGSISLGVLSVTGTPSSLVKKPAPASPAPATNSGPGWAIVNSPNPTEQVLDSVSCLSETDCWAVGYYISLTSIAQTLFEHWDGHTWSIVASPNAATAGDNRLQKIVCISTSNCWAVGYYVDNSNQTFIEHWDGNSWSIVSSPSPSSTSNILRGVACSSSSDCWAVGSYRTGTQNRFTQTLAEHWDGTSWSVITSANTGPTQTNALQDVNCTSSSNCWAVGYYFNGTNDQTLSERWNGTSWSVITSPNAAANQDNVSVNLTCVSNSDCWTVGFNNNGNFDQNGNAIYQPFTEHWDGAAWTVFSVPSISVTDNSFLGSVACISTSNCWAVGYDVSGAMLDRWDGNSWTRQTSPTNGIVQYSQLLGVACPSSSQCWAVGSTDSPAVLAARWDGNNWSIVGTQIAIGGGSDTAFLDVDCTSATNCWAVGQDMFAKASVQHWDGTAWARVYVPFTTPLFHVFTRVTCTTASDCWAAGYSETYTNDQTLTAHWDGISWSEVASPGNSADLNGVACTSGNNCWAVGVSAGNALIEHWDGVSWTIVPAQNPGAAVNNLSGVSCASASDCWAVGEFANSPIDSATPTFTLVEHWNGTAWTVVSSPNVGQQNSFNSVVCPTSSECFAVGYETPSGGSTQNLIERWDGTLWSVVNITGFSELLDIACGSTSNCWAVGIGSTTLHWDGSGWTAVSSPSGTQISGEFNALAGVGCPSDTICWAVGYQWTQQGPLLSGWRQTLAEMYSISVPPLLNVGSRMTHGSAGTFDLNLSLTGTPAIECRRGGLNGNYSVVFNFANDVTNCGTPTNAGGSVVSGPNTNQCTVNLTDVPNGQTINVELDNVADAFSNTGNVSVPMGVLIGDTTGNGIVNSSDIAQTQSQSGQPVTQSNFREDVTVSGAINSSDVALVQSQSGTALPTTASNAPVSTSPVSKLKLRRPARNQ